MDSAKIILLGKPSLNIEEVCVINLQMQNFLYWYNSKKAFDYVEEQ